MLLKFNDGVMYLEYLRSPGTPSRPSSPWGRLGKSNTNYEIFEQSENKLEFHERIAREKN